MARGTRCHGPISRDRDEALGAIRANPRPTQRRRPAWAILLASSLGWAACSDDASNGANLSDDTGRARDASSAAAARHTSDGASDANSPVTSTPLAERKRHPDAETRFRALSPEQTGIDFVNQLLPAHVVPYLYNGAGLAVGDYDGDGRPDVYLVSQDGPNRLFRQVAPLRFEDVTASAGGLDGGDAWGTAASFVDIDGDGDLDLYVCNLEAPNLLYQNQGDGTFVECAGKFGLAIRAASTGAAFADFDNDGDLDLYLLCNRVLGPTLPRELAADIVPPADTRVRVEQMLPQLGELEYRDGKPIVPNELRDLFFAMGREVFAGGQSDRLIRNDGYANWNDVSARAGIADHGMGLSATWWDFDGDGWLDLYVANDLESPDALYHNRRDGTFENVTSKMLPHTAYFGMGADFGDIDGDGRFDLCVADMSSRTHYMSKMLMGNMGDRRWFLMNADPQQYMRNALYLNTGTSRFLEGAYLTGLASTDWTWAVRFVDLDEDGKLDFFASNGIPRFDNDPDIAAQFRRMWRLGDQAGALDLARNIPAVAERNVAKRNLGDLRFEDVGARWGLDEAGVGHGAAFVDLDRDGDLDLIVNNLNAPASVFENNGTDSRSILVALRGTRDNQFGVGSRIEVETPDGRVQVRLLTLARGYMTGHEPVEHVGLGTADRVTKLTVRWPDGSEQTHADLAVDHLHVIRQRATPNDAPAAAVSTSANDLATNAPWFTAAPAPEFVHREREYDDYAVQPLLPHRLSRLGPGIAVGDVDGDGRDDLWIGGAAGQPGSLSLSQIDGTWRPFGDGPWVEDAECEDMGAVMFDFDGDGDLDLFVVSGGIESASRKHLFRDRLYVNRGDATFVAAPAGVLPDLEISGSCVAAADFDRDGDLDLFVGGRTVPGRFPEAPPSVLLRNDSGRFIDATAELCPELREAGMVTAAIWVDLDGDGWLDLAVAANWQPVRVFANGNGKKFRDVTEPRGLDALRGLWNGLVAVDVDRDGDFDLVATNLGLNTKYKADPLHPLRLFGADFDRDGVFDVVEAKYEAQNLLPVRGRSCSSEAMPFIAERFGTFDAFARASLDEIYGDVGLEAALQVQTNELRHLVLENRGAEGFSMHELPRRAQLGPGYGIGAADFDGDGHVDLAIAQNSFSPEPETGRFAGALGAVLAGRQDGGFDFVRAATSGVVIPDDAAAMAVVDLDGDNAPDLVCAINDGPARALRSASGEGRHLAVRLRGPAGNPSAIGARVELHGAEGEPIALRCVFAGDGYLTQSTSTLFFAAPRADGARLIVVWPDGNSSRHAVPSRTGLLTIESQM